MSAVKSRKLRVLRIIARMNIGGPAIQVTTLMNYIPKGEVEQLLITGNCEEGEADYLEFNQIQMGRLKISGLSRSIDFFSDLKAMLKIRKTIKEFRPDIVHTHTFKAGLLGRLAALSLFVRPLLVHTFHGHLLHGYFGPLKLNILKRIERTLADKTDVLISVGEKVMSELIAAGIGRREKFEIVPPGFPIKEVDLSEEDSSATEHRKFTCGWIGRLVEIKAPERVLEIARLFSSKESNVQFWVAGDGPLRDEVQKQSELESLPIKFLGWTGDIQNLLSKIDLLILTSINEGTPLSIIEAQRMGKPVISSDVGSVSEILSIGKSGYAIDYDPSMFAELINSFAIDKGKWKSFSEAALQFSGEKFSPQRLAQDHLRIYRTLKVR